MVGRNMSLKNPVTPPGIDSGTVRLVAQCLNHYATLGPFTDGYLKYKHKIQAVMVPHQEEDMDR